jgi:hypothetical protein
MKAVDIMAISYKEELAKTIANQINSAKNTIIEDRAIIKEDIENDLDVNEDNVVEKEKVHLNKSEKHEIGNNIIDFMALVGNGIVEIYNEFSLQYELGIYLREKLGSKYKIQFETDDPELITDVIDDITSTLKDNLSEQCTKFVATFTYDGEKVDKEELNIQGSEEIDSER